MSLRREAYEFITLFHWGLVLIAFHEHSLLSGVLFCGSLFLSITLLSCSFQSASSILVSLELLSLVSRDLATLFFSKICPTPGAFSKVCCSFLLLLTLPWEHLLFTSCTAPVFRSSPFVERFASPAATVGGDEVGSDPDDTLMAPEQNIVFVELGDDEPIKSQCSCGNMHKAGTCVTW